MCVCAFGDRIILVMSPFSVSVKRESERIIEKKVGGGGGDGQNLVVVFFIM